MSRHRKTYEAVISGRADANIGFADLCGLLRHLGFVERVRGSHHIFVRDGVDAQINLQRDGAQAKRYQVKQVREELQRAGLEVER